MLAATATSLDAVVSLAATRTSSSPGLLQRAQIEGRADDTEEVIRRRQEVYEEQTAPLIAVYADRGLLVEVDGMGEIDAVTHRIFSELEQLQTD
jgi:adenylate kinase